MQLAMVLDALRSEPALDSAAMAGDLTVDVTGVDHDSRAVSPGSLFCCVPGSVDGHRFAPDAVAAGAVALLCERPLDLGVAEVRVRSTRAAMGPISAEIYGRPSQNLAVLGVTGTNGKTTTVHLLAAIFQAAGRPATTIGTLTGARTTPEAPDLQRALAAALAGDRTAVAMEVSSHALDQHRVDGTHFAVALFTNLSRDHLDYHADMSAYFAAKARLFSRALAERAVVNRDDPHGRLLADAAEVPTVGFSLDDIEDLTMTARGSRFRWRGQPIELPLAGRFNVSNALAAATAAAEIGLEVDAVAQGLADAGPIPGRFELVDAGQPFLVVVDYAHTPDGLRSVLSAARDSAVAGAGRVLVVFGAGGDRDRDKRPEMGDVAAELADRVVITSDNPRSEDPIAIIDAVRAGIDDPSPVTVEPDRAEAIALAIDEARAGDVIVIAGKGHETTQTIGEQVVPFDDREVARAALARRTSPP